MKFKCNQKDLLNALNLSIRAINPTNTLPVLSNLLIKSQDNKVLVASTNLEISITSCINADILEEGAITVPAKLITNFVSFLKDSDIDITVEDGYDIKIITPGTNTVIKGIPADEFPDIPEIEENISFSVSADIMTETINQVSFAASDNNNRQILTGVYFEAKEDILKVVATDSFRLSEKKIKLKSKLEQEIKCIIPARSISELGRIISGKKGDIKIILSKTQVLFKYDNVELISRLIKGVFPDYEQIILSSPKTKAFVNLNDIVLAIKRINLFAKENSNNIKIDFDKNNMLKLTTDVTQYGSNDDMLQISIEGEDNYIGVNSEYLLDVFSNISSKEVMLEVDTCSLPLQIKIPKNEDFLHVLMPLQL